MIDTTGRALVFGGLCAVLFFGGANFLALLCFAAFAYYVIKSIESNEDYCVPMEGDLNEDDGSDSRDTSYCETTSDDETILFSGCWGGMADDMFSDAFSSVSSTDSHNPCGDINPATGYPMAGCVDVAGNPYGTSSDSFSSCSISSDINDDMFSHTVFDDSLSSSCDIHDSFSSACDHFDSTSTSSCFDSFDSGIGGCRSDPFDD